MPRVRVQGSETFQQYAKRKGSEEAHLRRMAKLDKFASAYGLFLIAWSRFDLVIEAAAAKALELEGRDASVVLAGLMFQAKLNMLFSALPDDAERANKIKIVRHAMEVGERNAIIHGIFISTGETFNFITREVKDKLKVRKKRMTEHEMRMHTMQFIEKSLLAQNALGLSVDELDEYGEQILNLG